MTRMISIVMSYFNRLTQFDFTLQTISKSIYKNFEIICVDDHSDPEHDPMILLDRYPQLNLKIIKMSDVLSHRWYSNPCVPYNEAFRHCQGDTVIIQNPECCHIGDVIAHCAQHISEDRYLSYHCWSATKDQLHDLRNFRSISYEPKPKAMWYNHEIYRPESFHFCTAILRTNLVKLNGFDERFAHGLGYDDNEFVQRVKNLGLKITYVSDPHVVHQPHPKFLTLNKSTVDNRSLFAELQGQNIISAPNKNILQ